MANSSAQFDPPFTVGQYFMEMVDMVDQNWLNFKELGNGYFASKDYKRAISSYSDGYFIASGSEKSVPFLVQILCGNSRNSAKYKFAQIPALIDILRSYMNASWIFNLKYGDLSVPETRLPNQAAAICLSNRSLSYVRLYEQEKEEGGGLIF